LAESPSKVGTADNDGINVKVESDAKTPSTRKRKASAKSSSASAKRKKGVEIGTPNPLDRTWIHPESYQDTKRLLQAASLSIDAIGTAHFIKSLKDHVNSVGRSNIASNLDIGEHTLNLMIDGLTQPRGYRDIREESTQPLYRSGVMTLKDLKYRMHLSGRVTNVVDFGAFVDIGVGKDALLHQSEVRRCGRWDDLKQQLGPNDVIQVEVLKVNGEKISLSLLSVPNNSAQNFV